MTRAHAQNVLCCVANNFLEVKQLASALLRQLPPSAVGLQVSDFGRVIDLCPISSRRLRTSQHVCKPRG